MNIRKRILSGILLGVVAVSILVVAGCGQRAASKATASDAQYSALMKKDTQSGQLSGWDQWQAAHPGNPGDPGAGIRMDQPPARLATKNNQGPSGVPNGS